MRKIIFLVSLILIVVGASAQNNANLPPKPIPSFKMLTTDSVWITQASLKKDRPVMFIYFMTDCPHCIKMMTELKPYLKQLANVQFVMVTFSKNYDIRAIKIFQHDLDLKKYPNIIIGTDGYSDNVRQYYDVQTTPFIAMYHANGKWAKYIPKEFSAEDIVAAVKQL